MAMKTDILVVGGGHAGIEAAHIAARKGLEVVLVTSHLDLIGQMSCNPAIGGIAKGNIVREIDALGGLMGKIIDESGIHFRMLNQSKGAAVWGNRAQADKNTYRKIAREELEKCDNISLFQGMVVEIICKNGKVEAVRTDTNQIITTKAIVLATGTFLNGVVHIGLNSYQAGRTGEPPSLGLTESLGGYGIETGRLKTGTSPRIDGRSVDFSKLDLQEGDKNPWPFSFFTKRTLLNKVFCFQGKTNNDTHSIINENLDKSPLYRGKITSVGPRYCPSIEDKVMRFGDRNGHTLFLEPESLENKEFYLNGLSTSMPFDIQERMVRSIKGLEKAKIIRPGYGIEYDYFQPLQLKPTLESKIVGNLYFAGQINGTSGYEEAACQGLIAGMNAALSILQEGEMILGRETSYTGVLIDDLIMRGTEEPYRMFTSRAEYRLLLRQDNCDERLMPISFEKGFIDKDTYEERLRHWDRKKETIEWLGSVKINPADCYETTGRELKNRVKAIDLLRRPEFSLKEVLECVEKQEERSAENRELTEILIANRYLFLGVESDIKYKGFVQKQLNEVEKIRRLEKTVIPEDIDYKDIPGLLIESRTKMDKVRPRSLGQASRIPGVTPADISILALYLSKEKIK
ncbi:tRNA uridine 5-carboxymethylaminomethyl modification enzyme GidA [Chitinispirillum alkaliphilum]|nr:tRNA uridine 5-carboxymethylaminomethyl modification enzyme GidA [Chitinispirillum alkaliphilum]